MDQLDRHRAFAQVAATALMLAAMGERSFVVTIAYIKTEPIQVAVFGLLFLGDRHCLGLRLPRRVALLPTVYETTTLRRFVTVYVLRRRADRGEVEK